MACEDCEDEMTWEQKRRLCLELAVQSFPPGDARGPAGITHAAQKFYEFLTPPDIEGIIPEKAGDDE